MFRFFINVFPIVFSVLLHVGIFAFILYFDRLSSGVVLTNTPPQKFIVADLLSAKALEYKPYETFNKTPAKDFEDTKGDDADDQDEEEATLAAPSDKDYQHRRGGNTRLKANSPDSKTDLKTGRTLNTKADSKAKKSAQKKKSTPSASNSKDNDNAQSEQTQSQISGYYRRIDQALVSNWTRPAHLEKQDYQPLVVKFQLTLKLNGEIQSLKLLESSGDNLFDRSALVAIQKVRRFTIPKSESLFNNYFKTMTISFQNPME